MAKKPNATREFKTQASQRKKSSSSRSTAYRTARIARERQKREIEQQKREKMMFALFVVVILVMLLFAILVFKKALGNDEQPNDTTDHGSQVDDTREDGNTDVPYSTTISVAKSAVNSGSLILVNAQNGYVSSQSLKNAGESRTAVGTDASGKTVYSYYLASKDGTLLDEDALVAFNSMADDFYKATKSVDLFVAKAYTLGTDEYATGLALDLSIWTGGNNYYPLNDPNFADDFDWIFENYYKYGFIISHSTNSSFCFRYVGVPHAYYMHKHDLTLEKYLELVKRETLAYTDNNGDKYEVYYVHTTGDVVSVPLYSADAEYSISGDNSEGLIVSVKVN